MAKLSANLMWCSEHLGISNLIGEKTECKPSAVSDQLLLHNHVNDFNDLNDFIILCWDSNGFRFLLKESFLISRDSPVANKNIASILYLLFI